MMKRPRFNSLQTRIVVLFLLLFLVVQGVGFSFIVKSISDNSRAQLREELLVGERIFAQQLAQNGQRLIQAGNILAADFGFRGAVATNDSETIVSALRNHGNRIQANLTMFADLDGKVLASSIPTFAAGSKFPFPAMIKAAEQEGSATSIVQFSGVPYQLVVVPVKAPVPIGWIAFGFRIDDADAREFEALTGITLSVVTREGTGKWTLVASSLSAPLRDGVTEAVGMQAGTTPLPQRSMTLGGEEYESRIATLTKQGDATSVAILQRSVSAAAEPYQKLQATLLVLTLGGIGLLLAGSMVVSRRIARPVRELAASAKLIEQGDYSHPVNVQATDEIGELAASFNHMQGAISAREARITQLAYSDELTGLPNRALFMDRLEQAVKASRRLGQPMSVLVMDMDRFKLINDTLGHQCGDGVLKVIGERIRATLTRASDTVARLGGDEFAVLLPVDDADGAAIVAQRIIKALEVPVNVEGVNIDAAMSLGIVTAPVHGEDGATLMRRADIAMYEAKRNGAGWAHYDLAFDGQSSDRLSMLSELRSAMERDELVLYYQPKVEIASGSVLGVEVLLRWVHPVRGFVPPDQFIPYAEQTGFITQITRWVLARSFAQCAEWRRLGRALNVAVNLSARDLHAPGLVEYVQQQLEEHGVNPEWVTLEVTESAVMNDAAHALATLQRLHAMDLKLSIDDFGTGYSSFAYLKKMPVDELKIDRSFVKDMISERDDASIVRAVIELSHSLGLKVTAEGTENQEVVDALASMHCDLAQGYHWSRPLAKAQFEQWHDGYAVRETKEAVVI
jgi:diguanylate cyclase (GGDEF)-like protein